MPEWREARSNANADDGILVDEADNRVGA